ncbi:hypothetical protein CR513_08928, partial [Mucuna pruriens]
MLSEGANNHSSKMSFRITKEDRFFSRLMAKESTTPNSSSRIFYYGEKSVAVPFTWEAQPGTPKHPLSETSLPPLTPPPSYFSTSKSHTAKRGNTKSNNVLLSILPRLIVGSRKSRHVLQSSSWSPSSSSSSSSSSCSFAYYSSSPSFSRPFKYKGSNGFRGCYPFRNTRNATVSHGVD